MDWTDPRARAAFFEVHRGLPREGPGNGASAARALEIAGPLPARPRVLDIGCGPGAGTMDLATLLPDARIAALDLHRPFLDEVGRRAREREVADRVAPIEADMAAPPFRDRAFDLLWCEGAAYIIGLERALRRWRALLVPGGRLALTEAVWLRGDPPEEARRCWSGYPAMGDVAACRGLVGRCGYELIGDFVLPEHAWWNGYYGPMEARIEHVARERRGDPVAEGVLDECRAEIATYRRFSAHYGYAFLIMTPSEAGVAGARRLTARAPV